MQNQKSEIQLLLSTFLIMLFIAIGAFSFDKMDVTSKIKERKKQIGNTINPKIEKSDNAGAPTLTYKRYVNLKKDKYDIHRNAAQRFGIPPIENEAMLNKYISRNKLFKIKDGVGFKLYDLTHSSPYLNKASQKMLLEIGEKFSKTAGYDNYFMVTSLTRTLSEQKKLSRVNVNATRGISTHSYGASFDISYVRFNGIKGDNPKLRSMLESILYEYQKSGRIFIVMERRSACYHITARY